MEKYTCVLFDIDNTLVDTDPLIKSALQACGCSGVKKVSLKDLRTLSPNKLLRKLGSQATASKYWGCYKEVARSKAQLLDGDISKVLEILSNRGVLLGIVTSSRSDVAVTVLNACNISHFFSGCIVSFGSCTRRKPHGDPILFALEKLNHPTEGTIYIGDAERDALASQEAGVDFGLAGWAQLAGNDDERLHSDIELTRFRDLLNYT